LIARLRADQLQILRTLTDRQVPISDGYRNMRDWIGARMDVSPETAGILSTLAGARQEDIDSALARGEITCDRAVELTRFESDNAMVEASPFSIPRLRALIASRRRRCRQAEREVFADRYLVLQPNLEQTALRLWGELVGVDSVRFEQILGEAADAMPALPDGYRESRRARLADALTNAVIDGAIGEAGSLAPTQVTTFVDAREAAPTNGERGVHIANGPRLGPQALEQVMCNATVEVVALVSDGTVLGVGDRSSTIPPRVHRYVRWRDQCCVADGCTSRYRLEVHHIRERNQHGDHDPDNLVLLCWHHHHVVIHGRGYRIDPDSPRQRLRFLPPSRGPDPPS
jgi:hypothetical protein